jgi:hypothetical protein
LAWLPSCQLWLLLWLVSLLAGSVVAAFILHELTAVLLEATVFRAGETTSSFSEVVQTCAFLLKDNNLVSAGPWHLLICHPYHQLLAPLED